MKTEPIPAGRPAPRARRRVAMWYFLAIAWGWVIIESAMMVMIVPTIVLQYDTGEPLSRPTTALIEASQWMAGSKPGQSIPGWALATPLLLVLLTAIIVALRRWTLLLAIVPLAAIVTLIVQLVLLLGPLYNAMGAI